MLRYAVQRCLLWCPRTLRVRVSLSLGSLQLALFLSLCAGRGMTFSQAAILGFRHKSFRFYGRSSRHEFWYFYLSCLLLGTMAGALSLVPVVGSLLVALCVLYLCCCQISSLVRRLHDCNQSGKVVALPFVLMLAYFVARIPLYALYPEAAALILNLILGLSVVSYLFLLGLCCRKGQTGSNRYGTDPLDPNVSAQDFINPEHLVMPEYLGDPWRKFKAKYEANPQATAPQKEAAEQEATTTETTSTSEPPAVAAVSTPTLAPHDKGKSN